MLIVYKISDELAIPAQLYTHNSSRAIRDTIFSKYLYKITKVGICIRIQSIQLMDNVILRREAQLLIQVHIQLLVIKLSENEYFEGKVKAISQQHGVTVAFLGILEGTIKPQYLHAGTLFNNGQWILPYNQQQAFEWELDAKIGFRVQAVDWNNKEANTMGEFIMLKADQNGLGPKSWWTS